MRRKRNPRGDRQYKFLLEQDRLAGFSRRHPEKPITFEEYQRQLEQRNAIRKEEDATAVYRLVLSILVYVATGITPSLEPVDVEKNQLW